MRGKLSCYKSKFHPDGIIKGSSRGPEDRDLHFVPTRGVKIGNLSYVFRVACHELRGAGYERNAFHVQHLLNPPT